MTSKEISSNFPFESRYAEVHGSKIHYVEEGSGDPVLFLHGQAVVGGLCHCFLVAFNTHIGSLSL